MEDRPKLKIKFTSLDWSLETISLIGVLAIIIYTILIYNKLPSKIPGHFDFSGNVTRYTGKGSLVALPIVTLFLYILLTLLEKAPHIYNYVVTITKENAIIQYTLARRMLMTLKIFVICIFLILQISICKTALKGSNYSNPIAIMLLTVLMFITIGYYIHLSLKKV